MYIRKTLENTGFSRVLRLFLKFCKNQITVPSALRSFTLAVFSKSRFPAKTQAFFLFSICLQTISKDIPPYFFE